MNALLIARRQNLNAPALRCGGCGVEVKALTEAGVVWATTRPVEGDLIDAIVLCKSPRPGSNDARRGCLTAAPYEDHPSMELSEYLGQLLFNLGLKTPAAWIDFVREARTPAEP